MALLEKGEEAFAFATGLAAITCCIHLFKGGDHVIVSEDLYGGTFRLFDKIYSGFGIEVTFVDTSDLEEVKKAVKEKLRGY